MPNVSFNIATWNGGRYLPDLLSSLEEQTLKAFAIRVIDNASDDETPELLRAHPNVTMIRNSKNLGFAVAHNQGMRLAMDKWEGEDLDHCYIIVANQDLVLTPTCLAELVNVMEAHPEAGSAQGKLLRAYLEHPEDDYLIQTVCADRFDSAGLRAKRSCRFSDRGAGEMDEGQYNDTEEVFGPTGALCVYRASALASVRFGDEFFDGDFFMYKEDIDLAWRLQRAGWKSFYHSVSVAYHHRGLAGNERAGVLERVRNRRRKRPVLSFLSTRNQYLMLLKNLGVFEGMLRAPWILFVEGRQLMYSIIFEPRVVFGLVTSLRLWPGMLRKRRVNKRVKTVSFRQLNRWFR